MRAISIAAAVLTVVALFFGNCLTCPLMAASPGCCHRNQPCHRNAPLNRTCQAQVLHHFVKAHKADRGVTLSVVSIAPETRDRVRVVSPRDADPAAAEYGPPDLLSLHSSLRI